MYSYDSSSVNYIYGSSDAWTMTPAQFHVNGRAFVMILSASTLVTPNVNVSYGMRPVINLSPNVMVSGEGTATNPYKVTN